MNDKNKIKSEIERLLNKEWKWGSSIEAKFRCEAYRELLEFIDSLPKESASENLEKASENHALQCHSKKASVATLAASKYDFIAGANWQKRQLINKAYEWLENLYAPDGSIVPENIRILKDFRKAMED